MRIRHAAPRQSAAAGLVVTLVVMCGCSNDDDAAETPSSEAPNAVATTSVMDPAATSPESSVSAPPVTTQPPTTSLPPPVELSTLIDPSNARNLGYTADPGRYVTDRLGVPTEVTLDQQLEYLNFPGHVSFVPLTATPRDPIGVFIHEIVGLVPAGDMATPREGRSVPEVVDPVPESFDDWFDAEPRIEVVDQGDSTIAGSSAPWWDFVVAAEAGETFQCSFGRCITFVVDPNIGPTVLGDEWQYRMWHLTAFDDSTIIAFVEATPETWDDTLVLADGVLGSLTILPTDGSAESEN